MAFLSSSFMVLVDLAQAAKATEGSFDFRVIKHLDGPAAGSDVDRLNKEQWDRDFILHYWGKRPAILTGWKPESLQRLKKATKRKELLRKFGDMKVQVGSGRTFNLGGIHSKMVSLRSYLEHLPSGAGGADDADRSSADYLFDDGSFLAQTGLSKDLPLPPPGLDRLTWKWSTGEEAKIRFAIGAYGQGISFHSHSDSYNIQIHGEKRWGMYAPGNMTPTGFFPDENYASWLKYRRNGTNFRPPDYECIQRPGEVLYVPESFAHATICLGNSVAIVQHSKTSEDSLSGLVGFGNRESDPIKSIEYFRNATKIDPTKSDLWESLAICHRNAGHPKKFVKFLHKALEVNPLDPSPRARLLAYYKGRSHMEKKYLHILEASEKLGRDYARAVQVELMQLLTKHGKSSKRSSEL
eukprot:TRINITY_DN8249_c0_g1_i2.p1 TRINITY_DN8249_c0_g1~~TRINITY_DN8249_c0_g1_i2.p1  ORF type:complete len:417 (-),score=52.05 TRINITY_DN8249_c0_g1_i2:394-1623(-)